MKKIKINFVDFFKGFNKNENEFIDILKEKYNVELSDNPEYLFYSSFGYEHLNYSCIRIFYTGECETPNFNECDYAIGFDRLTFGDRYQRVPLYMLFQYKKDFLELINRKAYSNKNIKNKKFCNFIYSNCFAQDKRTEIFHLLNKYKTVDSGGRYLNNIGGAINNKRNFQENYKFSIAFENTTYNGYTTEKITEAFVAGTIPIYYGDPLITEDFNENAFINCHQYRNFYEVVERVKEIDQNDELFFKILNTPPVKIEYLSLHDFLYHIIELPYTDCFRRPISRRSQAYEEMLKRHTFFESKIYPFYQKTKNLIQRFKTGTILTSRRKL